MQPTQHSSSEAASAIGAAYPAVEQRRVILTVRQFHHRNPAFSEHALRNLIFRAEERQGENCTIPGNGLIESGAVIRIGRKVLIDEANFFAWIDAQQKRSRN